MGSTAEILLVGQATFTMAYEYESINDVAVQAAGAPGVQR